MPNITLSTVSTGLTTVTSYLEAGLVLIGVAPAATTTVVEPPPYSELARSAEMVRQLTALGIDVFGVDELDLFMDMADGPISYLQSVARRFLTPRGSLRRHPDYGYDLRDWLNESIGEKEIAEIRSEVEREAEKDERTDQAEAEVYFDALSDRLYVDLSLTTSEGPYRLVMTVTELDVQAFLAEG